MKLIDKQDVNISIRRQCELIRLNRSDYYYERRSDVSNEDKIIMDEIDRIHTKRPFYGRPRIPTNESHGDRSTVSKKEYEQTRSKSQDISVFIEGSEDRETESGMGSGYYVYKVKG